MEFFRQANINWMGRAKYFFALSGFLLLIGGASLVTKGGLRYGIDFKGGTLVTVRFAQPPNVDKIRTGLAAQGLGTSEIQKIVGANEVQIGIEQKGQGEEALDAGKATILKALSATFGSETGNRPDFNVATPSTLAQILSQQDPLALRTNAGDRYTQLARRLTDFRDKDRSGLLTNFDDLREVEGVTPGILATLKGNFALGSFTIRNVEIVGPKVGAQLRRQAVYVTLYALAGMLVYIAFRFEWVYGAAAVLAVFHDVLITLGFFSLLNFEVSLTVIAALLTLVGYSMNDTIVIFDRIRENSRLMRKDAFADIVNRSINQTLSRTILTSGLTFLTVLVLFLLGGEVLRAFSFALVVGIVVGTYSSFGIAAPIVVAWNRWRGQRAAGSGSAAGLKTRGGGASAGRLVPAGRR
ncbi:MAG: protein translocase subunit SecF [Candidatus Acidiferrales bacterium]|jgi:preprotein translocase subunit SecF